MSVRFTGYPVGTSRSTSLDLYAKSSPESNCLISVRMTDVLLRAEGPQVVPGRAQDQTPLTLNGQCFKVTASAATCLVTLYPANYPGQPAAPLTTFATLTLQFNQVTTRSGVVPQLTVGNVTLNNVAVR